MNENISLEQELERQVFNAQEMKIPALGGTLAKYVQSDPYSNEPHVSAALHSLSRHIALRLENDERFCIMRSRWFDFGNGSVPIRLANAAIALLRVAILDGVKPAINWLSFVDEQQDADGLLILAVWGVGVDSPLEITADISLWPFNDLPDSYAKRMFISGSGSLAMHTPFDYEVPRCALVHRTRISQLRTSPATLASEDADKLDKRARKKVTAERQRIRGALTELAKLFSVFGPQISIAAMSWFTFEDQRLEQLRVGATRYFDSVEVIPLHIPETPSLVHAEVAPVLSAFLKLQSAVRAKLSVPLERLSLALRRHDAADKAVELSIALESLVGDGANNEVTHKATVRVVRLMGGDSETRARNKAVVGATYRIRSKRVHEGKRLNEKFTVGDDKLTVDEVTNQCATLCASLIAKIITIGDFPKWADFDIS